MQTSQDSTAVQKPESLTVAQQIIKFVMDNERALNNTDSGAAVFVIHGFNVKRMDHLQSTSRDLPLVVVPLSMR